MGRVSLFFLYNEGKPSLQKTKNLELIFQKSRGFQKSIESNCSSKYNNKNLRRESSTRNLQTKFLLFFFNMQTYRQSSSYIARASAPSSAQSQSRVRLVSRLISKPSRKQSVLPTTRPPKKKSDDRGGEEVLLKNKSRRTHNG